jgi:RNA polymerase sigma-70 factor, ECF subfamily
LPDDRLRLIFTCCHPALSAQAQLALTLRLLGGLSTEQYELPDRLRPVLAVVCLVDNAGLAGAAEPGRGAEAVRLARILVALMPDEPEVAGLLARLLLTESCRASRPGPTAPRCWLASRPQPMGPGPDRRGQAILGRCLRRNQPGADQLQAASTPGTPMP